MKKIRVLVVDDSALMRKLIPQILSSDPDIEVLGTAMDGIFAMKKIADMQPDVVTLDLDMPRMDGIETLRRIVDEFRTPVIIVSSLSAQGADLTIRALEIGAFDFVTKPQGAISLKLRDIANELAYKIKAAARYSFPTFPVRKKILEPGELPQKTTFAKPAAGKVLAIGVSTGGPNVLSYLLPLLPEDFPAAVLIVQHMPPGFTEMFAMRLNTLCRLEVKEARDGDLIVQGRVLIAPGDFHMKVKRLPLGTITVLSKTPPVNGHRPSAEILFRSVAAEYGSNATGLIMTGMGEDGSDGIGAIMMQGGYTIAQDEKSCVVFGMPKAAIEKGHIQQIVPLEKMGEFLINHYCGKEKVYGTVGC